ncbi:hypothetical protein [Planctomicrobium sp. SH664]|uniref:hypothetical protein n=1 Tax=Planctomicrobium sp. SH664 TaxID=3448125 RepID=UPI003F5BD5AE
MRIMEARDIYACNCDADDVANAMEEIISSYTRAGSRLRDAGGRVGDGSERRTAPRYALVVPFYLRPIVLTSSGIRLLQPDSLIAVTRDVARKGIGFQYDSPFEAEHILAEFDTLYAGQQRLVVEIRWQLKRTRHCYIAGGAVVGLVTEQV